MVTKKEGMMEICLNIPNPTRDLNGAYIEFVLYKKWKSSFLKKNRQTQLNEILTLKSKYKAQFVYYDEEVKSNKELGYLKKSVMYGHLTIESKFLNLNNFVFVLQSGFSFFLKLFFT